MEVFFLFVPFVSLKGIKGDGTIYSVRAVLFAVPFIVMGAAWIIAILRRREEIWPPGEPYRPRFVKVWRTIGYYYPLIQFISVVIFPMGYWVLVVEFSTLGTQDNTFSLSFGQVFALFVAVPPFIQVTQLLGEVWYWFRGVSWVRRIAGPPPERRKNEKRDSFFSVQEK